MGFSTGQGKGKGRRLGIGQKEWCASLLLSAFRRLTDPAPPLALFSYLDATIVLTIWDVRT